MLIRHINIFRNMLVATLLAIVALIGASSAHAEAPRWDILTRSAPTNLSPGGEGEVVSVLINLGDAPVVATAGDPAQITDGLPAGLSATHVEGVVSRGKDDLGTFEEPKDANQLEDCTTTPAPHCSFVGTLPPFIAIELRVRVKVLANAPVEPHEENEVKVTEGGVAPKSVRRPIKISSEPTPFGIEHYELTPEEEDGSAAVQAGSHPFQLTTTIALNEAYRTDPVYEKIEKPARGYPAAPALLRNLNTTLPPGLVADTRASVFRNARPWISRRSGQATATSARPIQRSERRSSRSKNRSTTCGARPRSLCSTSYLQRGSRRASASSTKTFPSSSTRGSDRRRLRRRGERPEHLRGGAVMSSQ